jgi:hypothetical protein
MYPAKNGDAFLVREYMTEPTMILIDGGYVTTFQKHILPDLIDFAQLGYSLDVVVSTHIDTDHIAGLLSFFQLNGKAQEPKIIRVENVLHNSLRSFVYMPIKEGKATPSDKDLLTEICRRGYPIHAETESEPSEISARQGSSLACLLLKGGYLWNKGDGTHSINSDSTANLNFRSDLRFHVLGPTLTRLEQLYHWWVKELRSLSFTGRIAANEVHDDIFEFLCAFEDLRVSSNEKIAELSGASNFTLDEVYQPDDSLTNSSSISLIVEIGNSRLLFLGDSCSEDIELAIQNLPNVAFPLIFNVIKISHHGSLHNTSPSLLELIDSPIYLISSNGVRHSHPSFEVLKKIVDRPCDFTRKIYFNYSTPASQQMRNYISESKSSFEIYENAKDWIDITVR